MQPATHRKWHGKITAVDQHPWKCRITIELTCRPAATAALMKESFVEMEVLDGCEHEMSS